MSKYVHTSCSVKGCKQTGIVSLENAVSFKLGKILNGGRPEGWTYRDLGEVAEESYELCPAHSKKYRQLEIDTFRKFVAGANHATP